MNALEIKNLTKEYKDFKLDHISFKLPSGCILGLVGENGAGKSTTIKLIMNAIEKNEGEIFVFGKNNQSNFKVTKEEIGVVLDESGFPESLSPRQINSILKASYHNWDEELFFDYLKKFSLPERKSFKTFSRGMKMKLGIVAALSHHPKLLILDEPTSGLDPIARDEILDIFLDFTRQDDHSILISSHIISDLEKLCDYIAFLHKGKLVFYEEKDCLTEQYGKLLCTKEEAEALDQEAIVGRRESKYSLEILVKKSLLPACTVTEKVSIEDIILFMVKGEQLK